jgi:hypothetical protein
MLDPDLICMRITNVPLDSHSSELRHFLQEWVSKDSIDDVTPQSQDSDFVR